MASSYLPGGSPPCPPGAQAPDRPLRRALRPRSGSAPPSCWPSCCCSRSSRPSLWTSDASAIDTFNILQGPSARHWLGTNNLGQDVFYRVLVATRLSVGLALAATAIGVACGLVLGTAPLIVGRRAGRVVTSVINVAVAFPALLLALFFAVIFGVGARGALLAIGFASAPAFARLVRTLSASVAGLDYIAAARIAGVSRFRLLTRHVLPNIGETLIVNATIAAGDALLSFAGLSFLGLGVQAPSYDWGQLLNDGLQGIYTRPAAALAPGVAVVVAGLAFNLFGEALAAGLGVSSAPRQAPLRPGGERREGESSRTTGISRERIACRRSGPARVGPGGVVPRRRASRPRRQLHPRPRRGGRRGRRVRLGQVADRPGGRPAARRPGRVSARPRCRCSARTCLRRAAGAGGPAAPCPTGSCAASSGPRRASSSRTR